MVYFIEMKNKFNTIVTLSNIGASIYDIKTIDKNKKLESILYTPKNEDDFITERSYLGKTIGRTGGRISNSKFILNGKEYEIPSIPPCKPLGSLEFIVYSLPFNINLEFEILPPVLPIVLPR